MKVVPTRKNAFEMVGRMLGVESAGVKALGAALSLLRDPQTRAALDQINRFARLANSQGAVLADTPSW